MTFHGLLSTMSYICQMLPKWPLNLNMFVEMMMCIHSRHLFPLAMT